jgi:hypothetical protein
MTDKRKHRPAVASVMGFIDSVDTMVLGANTYHQSTDYWPRLTYPTAQPRGTKVS